MASGSQMKSGICADLPTAPTKSITVMTVTAVRPAEPAAGSRRA
jgi:hypothetical protein